MKKIMLCAALVVASFGFANGEVVKCTEKKCKKADKKGARCKKDAKKCPAKKAQGKKAAKKDKM